jgi:hypothetical protein
MVDEVKFVCRHDPFLNHLAPDLVEDEVLKQRDLSPVSKSPESNLLIKVPCLVPVKCSSVEPEHKAFEDLGVFFSEVNLIRLSFYRVAVQSSFKVARIEAEDAFVNGEGLLFACFADADLDRFVEHGTVLR